MSPLRGCPIYKLTIMYETAHHPAFQSKGNINYSYHYYYYLDMIEDEHCFIRLLVICPFFVQFPIGLFIIFLMDLLRALPIKGIGSLTILWFIIFPTMLFIFLFCLWHFVMGSLLKQPNLSIYFWVVFGWCIRLWKSFPITELKNKQTIFFKKKTQFPLATFVAFAFAHGDHKMTKMTIVFLYSSPNPSSNRTSIYFFNCSHQ